MKRLIRSLAAVIILLQCTVVAYAGESADIAADMILNSYYPALSAETAERIRGIAKGAGDDNDKIADMCGLLDQYSAYSPYGAAGASAEDEEQISYSTGKWLYIKINRFAYGVDDTATALLDENPDMPVLLDLTDCSGGVTAVMETIAGRIVPKGLIYTARFADGEQGYVSNLESAKRAVAVMTSENTASCAEIIAAALQDSGAGVVIGARTYGKAGVQNMRLLPNGGTLKITVGHWYTRNGADIGGIGIAPDIALSEGCIRCLKECLGVRR
jgi:hypothetical protein